MNLIKKIYNNSPIFLQNFLISLEGYRRKKIRFNNKFSREYIKLSELNELEKINYQVYNLNKYLKSAYQNCEYWKEELSLLNYNQNKEYNLEFLKKINIISKKDIQVKKINLENRNLSLNEKIKIGTSGTTGSKLNFYYDKKSVAANFTLCWKEVFHKNKIGDKYATFNGNMVVPLNQKNNIYWRENKAFNQTLFSIFHMNSQNLKFYYNQLKKGKYKFINGYPSAIFCIAEYIFEKKLDYIKVDAVYTSSEELLENQREVISKVFQCEVFDYYSNTEMSISAYQNEMGYYEVSKLFSSVWFKEMDEQIDGERIYKVIGTSFLNEAFYLINYDTGDLVTLNEKGQIRRIIGRLEDSIITPDGKKIKRLTKIFENSPEVKEAQIIQKNEKNILIKISLKNNEKKLKTSSLIEKLFIERCGNFFEIEFLIVKEIEKNRNGKYRFIICDYRSSK